MPVIPIICLVMCAAAGGFLVRPGAFPPYEGKPIDTGRRVGLPASLPPRIAGYYRALYGDSIPLITSAVLSGRATIRPVLGIPLPARFVFVHDAGHAYRHYFEVTWYGLPVLRVNEGYADGISYFESPMGTYRDDPNTNQGANLALWAEGSWFPSVFLTDPRVSWHESADGTIELCVPFGETTERITVTFDDATGLISAMEAMRFRSPHDREKIRWIARTLKGSSLLSALPMGSGGSAMWADQAGPWATFGIEHAVFNADVHRYVRQRGL